MYNASGMRILAEDYEGIKTQYTFDTGGKVVEKEVDGSIRNFFYLGSKVIAHKEAGETLYYGTDHLGSSALMIDATGAAVWTGAVTPFADVETTEGLAEHVMFTGKELDIDTGLYYYNARWYDPNLGRFITEDPVRDGSNWFVYVSNNPLKYVDPTGLEGVNILKLLIFNPLPMPQDILAAGIQHGKEFLGQFGSLNAKISIGPKEVPIKGSMSYDILNDKMKFRVNVPTGVPNTSLAGGINIEDGEIEGTGKLDLKGSLTLPSGLKISGGAEQTIDNDTIVKVGVGVGINDIVDASVEAKMNINTVVDYINENADQTNTPEVDAVTGAAPIIAPSGEIEN